MSTKERSRLYTGAAAPFRMNQIECNTEFGVIKLRIEFRGGALFYLEGTKRIPVAQCSARTKEKV